MDLLSNKVNIQQLHLTAVDLTQGQRGAAARDGSAAAESKSALIVSIAAILSRAAVLMENSVPLIHGQLLLCC